MTPAPDPSPEAKGFIACKESARPVTAAELADLSFFRGFNRAHLQQIAAYSKRCHFEDGEVLFEEGTAANCFFVVVCGRVVIEFRGGGKTVQVQEVGPGEPVGFSWFFNPDSLHFSARADGRVETVFFYGTLLREDCEIDHELGYELMQRTGQVMLRRLDALSELLAKALSTKAAPG